jgi:hypothetical protein
MAQFCEWHRRQATFWESLKFSERIGLDMMMGERVGVGLSRIALKSGGCDDRYDDAIVLRPEALDHRAITQRSMSDQK